MLSHSDRDNFVNRTSLPMSGNVDNTESVVCDEEYDNESNNGNVEKEDKNNSDNNNGKDDGERQGSRSDNDDLDRSEIWDNINLTSRRISSRTLFMERHLPETDGIDNTDRISASATSVLQFDDADAEYVSSDSSDLNWDAQSFDYVVPFDRPLLHEQYVFEGYPSIFGSSIRAISRLRLARRVQRIGDATASGARSIRGRLVDTYNDSGAIFDGAIEFGQTIAADARQAGGGATTVLEERWPNVVQMFDDNWLTRASATIRNDVRTLPSLDRQDRIEQRRR